MMTIFRKPWISVSSARTAGRCHPAWRRKTPRLYPAIISTSAFISGFGIIFSSSALRRILSGLQIQKIHSHSLMKLVQFANRSTTFWQFTNITPQSSGTVLHS